MRVIWRKNPLMPSRDESFTSTATTVRGVLAERMGSDRFPTPHLVLVNRKGSVAYIHVGAGREEKLERRVRRALCRTPRRRAVG